MKIKYGNFVTFFRFSPPPLTLLCLITFISFFHDCSRNSCTLLLKSSAKLMWMLCFPFGYNFSLKQYKVGSNKAKALGKQKEDIRRACLYRRLAATNILLKANKHLTTKPTQILVYQILILIFYLEPVILVCKCDACTLSTIGSFSPYSMKVGHLMSFSSSLQMFPSLALNNATMPSTHRDQYLAKSSSPYTSIIGSRIRFDHELMSRISEIHDF